MTAESEPGSVEVVYALADTQVLLTVDWRVGLTLGEAISLSGIVERFPEIEIVEGKVGVYGLRQPLDHALEPGDRVEIYRPLILSPTEARRLRAEREKP